MGEGAPTPRPSPSSFVPEQRRVTWQNPPVLPTNPVVAARFLSPDFSLERKLPRRETEARSRSLASRSSFSHGAGRERGRPEAGAREAPAASAPR